MKFAIFSIGTVISGFLFSIFAIFLLITELGCSSPEPPPEPIETDSVTATDNSTVYQQMINQLEKRMLNQDAQIEQLNNQLIELQYEILSRNISDALYEADYKAKTESLQKQVDQVIEAYTIDRETLETMNEELQKAQSRLALITIHINAVNNKSVPELSANLTAAEYDAFYKGWGIWRQTFNEKDGEE